MYYSLTEAAERLASAGIAITAIEILRLGVAGRAQITIPLLKRGVYSSAILRRLDAEWRQQTGKAVTPPEVAQELMARAVADLSGLYIVPPGHLLELEASGTANLEVVFSLDGEIDYRPYVDAKVEQLRVTVAELSRLLTSYATSQTGAADPEGKPSPEGADPNQENVDQARPRPYPEEQPTSSELAEYEAGWWESEMDASIWWAKGELSAEDASNILCGLNPLNPDADYHEAAMPSRETWGNHTKRLLLVFREIERSIPGSRTLGQWLKVAQERRVAYHPWIDEWLDAKSRTEDPVDASPTAAPAEASQPTGAESREETRPGATIRHKIKTRRWPLDAEIEAAIKSAANPCDPQSVWDSLCAMADKPELRTDVLLGLDDGGVKYRKDDGTPEWMNKRAFTARWRRRNGK